MLDRLPTPAPEEIRELITDRDTIRVAQHGVFQLRAIASKLSTTSFAAIARQQYRTEPLNMAIALLAHEIDRAAQEIEDHAQRSEQAKQEDQAQTTAPAQAAAGQTTGNAAAQPAQMTPAADTAAPETAAEGEAQPAVQDEQQPAADTEQNPDAIAPEN